MQKTAKRGRQEGRGVQRGKGKVARALKTRFNLLKRLAKSDIEKQVTGKVAGSAIKYAPSLYEKGVSRIKNKRIRNAFNPHFANIALTHGAAYA